MEKPNILLISVDTLRADHLGCYGYQRPTSPAIDALAGEGVLCERLLCPAIPTAPSYATLYTGQHPITHGIVAHPCKNELDQEAPFLPWHFLRAGYTTCAVDSLMRNRLWFGRGYEFYIDPSLRHTMLYLALTCEDVNARAIPWLRACAVYAAAPASSQASRKLVEQATRDPDPTVRETAELMLGRETQEAGQPC